jgi:AsmA protein
MRNKLLIAATALVVLVLLVVAGAWLLIDPNQFRPQLEQAMGGALGRKVSVGTLKVALLSGGVSIEDLAISDDPAFSTAPFVTAKKVTVGVDLMPLIFSHSLRVESFRLEDPQVALINSPSGHWNFSSLGGAASDARPPASGGSAASMSVLIRRVAIANGRIVVGRPGGGTRQRVYEGVNVEASDLSYTSQFPFKVTAKTPGGGTVALDGQAGPIDAADAANTPFHATADVRHLDVAASGFIDPSSGLAGAIDFAGTLTSQGGRLTSTGTLDAAGVQLVPGGSPAHVPVRIDYESDYSRKTQTGVVRQGNVHVGKALARLTGAYNAGGDATSVRLKLAGQKMAAADLEAALPALGIALPSGASLRDGTLDVDLTISGPIDRLVIAGPITLSHATLAGFDLGGKLGALPSIGTLGGLSKAESGQTLIETLSAALRIAPDGIRADNLDLVVPSIGTLTGGGTVAPKGALDFKMLAKLAATRGAGAEVSRLASLGQPANGVPFRVEGTMAAPVFVPDVGRAVSGLVKNPETAKKAASALGGLFGRKAP